MCRSVYCWVFENTLGCISWTVFKITGALNYCVKPFAEVDMKPPYRSKCMEPGQLIHTTVDIAAIEAFKQEVAVKKVDISTIEITREPSKYYRAVYCGEYN